MEPFRTKVPQDKEKVAVKPMAEVESYQNENDVDHYVDRQSQPLLPVQPGPSGLTNVSLSPSSSRATFCSVERQRRSRSLPRECRRMRDEDR
jgi:hypothetical protein